MFQGSFHGKKWKIENETKLTWKNILTRGDYLARTKLVISIMSLK